MAAALAAALRGARVVLCEATDQVGGTTSTSAGTLWIPGNRQGIAAGYVDSVESAAIYLDALIGKEDAHGLRRTFLAEAAAVIAEIERTTQVHFASASLHPDYVQAAGAALYGRALSPVEFDGRLLGADDFRRVRPPPPELVVLGGMMVNKADIQALFRRWRTWTGFRRSAGLVARYLRDRLLYPRGTRLVLGNALVARLLASLREAGVEIRFGHRLLRLLQRSGTIYGAVFEQAGHECALTSRAGIVLATGGIGHDAELRNSLAPDHAHLYSLAGDSVRGQGIAAARTVGAQFQRQANDFLWQPVSVVRRSNGTIGLFPHLYLDRAKPGLIAIDKNGSRFVDEGASYHHFAEAQRNTVGASAPAWLVCDSRFIRRYGLGLRPPGRVRQRRSIDDGLNASPTLDALAVLLGIDPSALKDTVARHNEAARLGYDPDYQKGSSPVARFNGDPTHKPNPCLGPITEPPFYALPVWVADAASSSGLATDADGAALDVTGRPIAGLHVCGNDMASVFQGSYPGPGATLGPALVFGWRAGVHAASQVVSGAQATYEALPEQNIA